ncbi:MAG: hypothetical protein RRY36_04390 [Bacteroidaceae bacterium]
MKKISIIALIVIVLIACGGNEEKSAQARLQAAQTALKQGDFSGAKLQIDSIKQLYPRSEARKEGVKLMQQIDLSEQQKSLAYLDSMLLIKQKEVDAIKGNYVFEKNAEYQKIGNYFHPGQTVEKTLHRSFLRSQVNELGVMTLTSVYCGRTNIHHSAVKVSDKEGNFAQTPSSRDSYETTDLGEKIEKSDYKMGNDGDVIGFIYLNKDHPIKVAYIGGDRAFSFTMSDADRKALAAVYELSQLLSSTEQIKKEIKEAQLKIAFVSRKMEEAKAKQ